MKARPDLPAEWGVVGLTFLSAGIGGTVWRAARADGSTVVVKVVSALAAPESHQAVAFLRWRDGEGAVRLFATSGDLQLLEDVGGTNLVDVLARDGDEAATGIAAQTIRRLHGPSQAPAPPQLQSLEARFASLFSAAARTNDTQHRSALFSEGATVARRLLAAQTGVRPLHGDIHHENILLSPRGWLAIDPHGLFGDPAYDVANLFYNPLERDDLRCDPGRAATVARIAAGILGRAERTLLEYGFCHACLSASWHLEDGNDAEAERSLSVAHALRTALAGC